MLTEAEIRADLIARLTGKSLRDKEIFAAVVASYPNLNVIEAGKFRKEFERLQLEGIVVQPVDYDYFTILSPE